MFKIRGEKKKRKICLMPSAREPCLRTQKGLSASPFSKPRILPTWLACIGLVLVLLAGIQEKSNPRWTRQGRAWRRAAGSSPGLFPGREGVTCLCTC